MAGNTINYLGAKTKYMQDEDGLFVIFTTARNLTAAFERVEQDVGEPLVLHKCWDEAFDFEGDDRGSQCVAGLASQLCDEA